MGITDHMTDDHKHCDKLFLDTENAVSAGDWETARNAGENFFQSIENHFAMEEQILFPEFEQSQGSEMGPTQVMRYEHEQIRGLLAALRQALEAEDRDEFLGEAETLMIFMQQHNAKEEMILYPMADQVFSDSAQVLAKMQSLIENE
ncbi:MAG: hemerythrin domain-containing protein [Gammaproteobacteria bacterium]|nr:hemerythrin domain-containing protein [Gammaproteobacteria bacterium]